MVLLSKLADLQVFTVVFAWGAAPHWVSSLSLIKACILRMGEREAVATPPKVVVRIFTY